MRLTNKFSVMGRKYDLAYGQANTWKRKLKNDKYELIENAIDKLGQLEDIEDELGIDLIIFLKALTHGFYYKNKDSISTMSPDEIALGEGGFSRKEWEGDTIWFFKDLGKTWALTEGELENE